MTEIKKQITLEDLAVSIEGLSERMDRQGEALIERMDKQEASLIERMDKKVEELAIMTAEGFEDQKKYIDKKFIEELAPIKAKLSEVVTVDYLNKRISELNGESITRDRKLENCQSAEIQMHVQNENLTRKQQQELAGLKIFPAISQA